MSKLHITTSINNEPREYLCEPNQSMLDVLRDELGLTGTKEGCGTGDCGACSILVDGRLVCACLMLGAEAQDADIETIEGVAGDAGLHPLQSKFLEHAALQCGICTPTEIASQPITNGGFVGVRMFFEQCFRRHNESRCTDSTLECCVLEKFTLQRV